jgi:hypothetical protein
LERPVRAGLTRAEGRKFGLSVGTAFLVLGGIFWWRGRETAAMVLGGLGMLLILSGLAIPGRLGPVYTVWMGMAHAISKVTTPLFMSIVYFVVLTPAGLIRRLVARNPLHQQRTDSGYWISRDGGGRGDLSRQF